MKSEITDCFDESSFGYDLRNYLRKMEGRRAIQKIEEFKRREMESSKESILDDVSLNLKELLKELLVNEADIEFLLKLDPAYVCCLNMIRDVLAKNKQVTLDEAIEVGKLSYPVFKELLALGIIPAELEDKSHD